MGRHAAAPTPSVLPPAAAIPGRRASTMTAGLLVSAAAVCLTVVTVLGVLLSGVGLLPRGPAAPAPTPTPVASLPRVALVATPAQAAVAATLSAAITGWRPASATAWTGGTPFDAACGRPSPDAALAANRIYDAPGGQAVVTVSAYSAGAGAVAFHDWSSLLTKCTGAAVSASVVSAPGTDAVVATIRAVGGRPGASVLLWRRGDVIASVAVPSVAPSGLATRAASVDAVLLTALTGRCITIASTMADAARSPWVDPATFTGRLSSVPVSVTPSPVPVPPIGVTPLPATYSPTPLPSVSYPARPADPVWPEELPSPVYLPVAPMSPTSAPFATTVPSRLDDPKGPGCGWAFTGQLAPPYDAANEATIAQARAEQAQTDLVIKQQTWQSDLVSYWEAAPVYEQQAQVFAAYAASVNQVALAWDTITRARDTYAAQVAAYDAAASARVQFFNDQAAAQAAYDAAIASCAAFTASPSPTPTPTPSDSLSPSPTDTATPTPTVTLPPGCPPTVPPILSQVPPTLPPIPVPPPDPRPSAS